MNEDPMQDVYYSLKKIGYYETAINAMLKKYHDQFLKIYKEAEQEAEALKQFLLKNKLYEFLTDQQY